MVKIGLIGLGHLGKIHLRILKGLPQYFEIVGVFDANPEVLNQVALEYGVVPFSSAAALIAGSDALDIVTPTLFHFDLAQKTIEAGKHVFLEKPITESLAESVKLLELIQTKSLVNQVGHVERFNPAFVAAAPFLREPAFIETHRLAQFNPRGTDVPVVLDLMIHDIDIILHVVNSPLKTINASGVAVVSHGHDITNARLEFENGTVANLTASRISMKNMRKSRFFQKDAYVGVDFLNKSIEVVRLEALSGNPDPYDFVLDLGDGKEAKKLSIENPKIYPTNAIEEELKEFAEAILLGKKVSVDFQAGHLALDVAYKIMDKLN